MSQTLNADYWYDDDGVKYEHLTRCSNWPILRSTVTKDAKGKAPDGAVDVVAVNSCVVLWNCSLSLKEEELIEMILAT